MKEREAGMIVLGVDPGQTGGMALIDVTSGALVGWSRMLLKNVGISKVRNIVDARRTLVWLMASRIDACVMEYVHAMPRQGVTSAFTFGRTTGAIEALVDTQVRHMRWVPPTVWKRHFGLTADKGDSLDMARDLWPGTVDWAVRRNDGIAEAALMAQWWIDTHFNPS